MSASQTSLFDTPAVDNPTRRSYEVPVLRCKLVREAGVTLGERAQITSPWQCGDLVNAFLLNEDRESLVVVMLDTKNRVIGINVATTGTINTAMVSGANVFKPAILVNAAAIVIAHNHPSGDCTPSPQDIAITAKLVEAGDLLDIPLLDHLIVAADGSGRYVSLKERGLIK